MIIVGTILEMFYGGTVECSSLTKRSLTMKKVFVVLSHVEIDKSNWSTEVVKAFAKREDAEAFARTLSRQVDLYGDAPETIELEAIDLIGD
jgi:hypothetical protein